jgi:hypothetical protein
LTRRILEYLRDHALGAVALVCSILALAGSSYAAFTINGSQIQNHTINAVKLNPKVVSNPSETLQVDNTPVSLSLSTPNDGDPNVWVITPCS